MRIHVLSDLWLDCNNRLAEAHWRLHDGANAIESCSLCATLPQRCSSGESKRRTFRIGHSGLYGASLWRRISSPR